MRDLNSYGAGIDVRPVLPGSLWDRLWALVKVGCAIAVGVAYLIGLLG